MLLIFHLIHCGFFYVVDLESPGDGDLSTNLESPEEVTQTSMLPGTTTAGIGLITFV